MKAQTEVIIGLDVGTTAVKVAAVGLNGRQGDLGRALREYRLEQPAPGWQVQDPPTVLTGIEGAVADCVAQLGDARVVAPSLSAAMHGLIGRDAQIWSPTVTPTSMSRSSTDVRALLDGYEQVATMFASSVQ